MNIACIAWGSLLWKPGPVKLASGWHPGGPALPLEFSRQSDDFPEIALALCRSAPPMPTYWAYLATSDLAVARAMLQAREQIRPERTDWVGSMPAADGSPECPRIAAWMKQHRIDAAVWTALPPKFDGDECRIPSAAEAVAWLDALEGDDRAKAEDYVRRTPAHIDTPYRRAIEARLGWRPMREAYVTRMA